jgi:hypothetical protein|tara:strand:+ start:1100 stop:1291 length:192 start_codon:yes stop_codon:yes gene_type:complete
MSEQPTEEQIVMQDLINQLADKDRSIVNYRVTITQLRAIIAATEAKEEAVETVEDKKKKESKD